MRKGDMKLPHYWDTKDDFLYDLAAALSERNDIAEAKSDVTAKMLAELKAHVRAGLGEQKLAALERGEFEKGGRRVRQSERQ